MKACGWLLAVLVPAAACGGDCRPVVRGPGVVVRPAFAVTPFAVPVAVPVATFVSPPVLYSFQGYSMARQAAAVPRATVKEAPPNGESAERAGEPAGIIQQKCGHCHGGEAPKAGLDLTDLAALDVTRRLEAVRRVVSDDAALRMPKGAALTPAEIGAVLQELSEVPARESAEP